MAQSDRGFPADLIKVARRKVRFALRLSKAFGTSQEIFQPAVPQIATFSCRSLKDIEAILEAHHLGTAKRGGFSRGLDR
jgi:hypothetical protein